MTLEMSKEKQMGDAANVTECNDTVTPASRPETGQRPDEWVNDAVSSLRANGLMPGQLATPEETVLIRRRHAIGARYEAPATWNIGHVDYRLVEAFTVLFRIPGQRIKPKEFGNAMPRYIHEWSDYVAQTEGERDARRHRNRLEYRHKGASADEVRRMDQALGWPLAYLTSDAEAARAALLAALWKALELDFERRIGRLGYGRATFFRHRKRGLESITAGLAKGRITCE